MPTGSTLNTYTAASGRLLRRRFELSPREEFLQRLRMAHRALQRVARRTRRRLRRRGMAWPTGAEPGGGRGVAGQGEGREGEPAVEVRPAHLLPFGLENRPLKLVIGHHATSIQIYMYMDFT